ncbi:MAG: hypothetical protein QM781_06410 [Chitinophagaceae bacterium]
MPLYLESIGFSIVLIGVLEGLAEAIAGLSKGYFGKLSDHTGRRGPFRTIRLYTQCLIQTTDGCFCLSCMGIFRTYPRPAG